MLFSDPPSTAPASQRRTEVSLIVLNLAVLANLAVLHVLFSGSLGQPPRLFYLAVFGRFLMQVGELLWLTTSRRPLADRLLPAYSHLSIWLHLGFAFLLSRLGGFEDSHYIALMVIPVLAAGFRYRWPGIATVVLVAVLLTFLEVRLYYVDHPRGASVTEYFEASSVALIYVVVAVVTALLSSRLRAEHARLQGNLVELETTRDRLVREEKLAAVGRLSSAIAHEIRNPVSLILSSLELARVGGDGSLSEDEVRDIVHTEAQRLERLTQDFLLYARQRPPEKVRTSLGETLDYVSSLLRGRLEELGLSLRLEVQGEMWVDADPFQLHQALLNLLTNALEAAPTGSTLRLGASPSAGAQSSPGVVLFVENPGPAIPSQTADCVFEPFFTTKASGTGLGLAIAREIALRHGGDLTLVVNRPDRVRFELRLPGPIHVMSETPLTEVSTDGPHPPRR